MGVAVLSAPPVCSGWPATRLLSPRAEVEPEDDWAAAAAGRSVPMLAICPETAGCDSVDAVLAAAVAASGATGGCSWCFFSGISSVRGLPSRFCSSDWAVSAPLTAPPGPDGSGDTADEEANCEPLALLLLLLLLLLCLLEPSRPPRCCG